jgi:hypothetical protein
MNGSYQTLVYADNVNLLSGNINVMKNNTKAITCCYPVGWSRNKNRKGEVSLYAHVLSSKFWTI